MERTIKTLGASNGELYVTSGGRREKLARFNGIVEIREKQEYVSLLGNMYKGTKRIYPCGLSLPFAGRWN